MNVRRFVLRLAVGLLCFAIGWGSAALLGARRAATRVYSVPHLEESDAPPPPKSRKSGCRAFRLRHAHEWREMPRHEEFELELEIAPELERLAPPPPPPPRPRNN